MYLAYCEAGFVERRIGVVQMHLAKPRWREHAGFTRAGDPPLALASEFDALASRRRAGRSNLVR